MKIIILIVLLIFAAGCSDDYLYGPDETPLIEVIYNGEFYVLLYITNEIDINFLYIVQSENMWICDEQFIIDKVIDYKSINIKALKVYGEAYTDAGDLTISLSNGENITISEGTQRAEINYIRD